MVKIELDNDTRTKIETLHKEWFFKKVENIIRPPRRKITRKKYISEILGLDEKNFETEIRPYILGGYEDIKKLISTNTNIKGVAKKKNLTKDEKKIKKRTDLILEAFGYNDFDNRNKNTWGAYKFCELLKVDICPYCNRQYVFTVREETRDCVTRPEIDHFYPKSIYPFLSLNIYNFIPSCHICNNIKNNAENNIIYPYEEGFGKDISFRVKYAQEIPENSSILDISNTHIFFKDRLCDVLETGKCIHNKQAKARKSIKTFHLEEIYNEHKIELQDLFTRYRNYSKPKIDEITRLIVDAQLDTKKIEDKSPQKHFKLTKEQKEELVQQVASTYTKRIKRTILGLPLGAGDKQYPLRKFKEDIIEQLDNTAKKMKTEARNKNISK